MKGLVWLLWHEALMSWSVTGLYAAGLVDSTYRMFPAHYFWWVSFGLSGLTFLIGGMLIVTRNSIYTRLGSVCRSFLEVSRKKMAVRTVDK